MLPVKVAPRKDPAPSRIRYRLQRLWLRPAVRNLVVRGLPILALTIAAAQMVADEQVRSGIQSTMLQLRDTVAQRPEFSVTEFAVLDASDELAGKIRAVSGLSVPLSSLDIDVETVRENIMTLDAVRTANVRLRAGGRLEVRVEERIPVIVWRSGGQTETLDIEGVRVAQLTARADRNDLPLIVGPGAQDRVAEATEIYRTAGPLAARIRGLVRVGERRWDIVLDRDQIIRLPETDARAALERVLALDAAEELLERDVTVVDMRDGRRPVLRLSPGALDELRRLRSEKNGEDA